MQPRSYLNCMRGVKAIKSFLTELKLIYYNPVNKKQEIQFETKGLLWKLFILLELVVRYQA